MINQNLLEDLSRVSIKDASSGPLADLLQVNITGETAAQRLESCIAQLGNPYCFRVGNTPVKLLFKPCEETLEQKIKSYFLGLKF